MVPGLWLEPEVAGKHSTLAEKPDSWFFLRHGQRVVKNSRLLLDFRNPEVRSYLDAVVERLVKNTVSATSRWTTTPIRSKAPA